MRVRRAYRSGAPAREAENETIVQITRFLRNGNFPRRGLVSHASPSIESA